MSVEQSDVIDFIGTDRLTGDVVLTISDHLDWSDSTAHQLLLQTKLNRYLAFVESGEILETYPNAKDKAIIFKVVFKFPPDASGRTFLARGDRTITEFAHRYRKLTSYKAAQPSLLVPSEALGQYHADRWSEGAAVEIAPPMVVLTDFRSSGLNSWVAGPEVQWLQCEVLQKP